MSFQKCTAKTFLAAFIVLFMTNPGFAGDKAPDHVEKQLVRQLEAVKEGDRKQFIRDGNEAFKDHMNEFWFDSLKMHHAADLKKGYTFEYLGAIKRLAAEEYLWRLIIVGKNRELLARLTLSHEKVVGFAIE